MKEKELTDFLTKNQTDFIEKIISTAINSTIAIIEAPHGAGLQHATERAILRIPKIKVIYIDCMESRNGRQICIQLLKEAMNVKFSNLNYFNCNISDLVRVVRERMKTDLSNQTVLLVIDHIDRLSIMHLRYLLLLIKPRNFKYGILLRTTANHRTTLEEKSEELYEEFYIKLTNDRLVAGNNTKDEMRIFIRDVQGINSLSHSLFLNLGLMIAI